MNIDIEFLGNVGTLFLSVLAVYIAYYDFTSPRTKLYDYSFSEDGERAEIQLTNAGLSQATLRVRMWVDGGDPFPDKGDFFNSLFAQNPLPAPWEKGVYPKRTTIARKDFRQFATSFPWVHEDAPQFPPLPTDDGHHEVRFAVQQTGENYVFEYTADGDSISDARFIRRYGGKHLLDRLRTTWYWFNHQLPGQDC